VLNILPNSVPIPKLLVQGYSPATESRPIPDPRYWPKNTKSPIPPGRTHDASSWPDYQAQGTYSINTLAGSVIVIQ
ncbi:MAG: hypothetical protein WCA08_22220, partial [Desulfoferrobacter sp.]